MRKQHRDYCLSPPAAPLLSLNPWVLPFVPAAGSLDAARSAKYLAPKSYTFAGYVTWACVEALWIVQ